MVTNNYIIAKQKTNKQKKKREDELNKLLVTNHLTSEVR